MIYIGIPARDEQHTVGVLLWRIRKLLSEEGPEFRVVVVDDASTDGTAETVAPYESVLPVVYLRNEERRGYAASVERVCRQVLERSDYHKRDGLVLLQADFTEAPEVIPEMVRRFQGGADLVAGLPSEVRSAPRRVRWARRAASWLVGSTAVAQRVRDPLCGFRLYRLFLLYRAFRDVPEGAERLLLHDGWAANAELLAEVLPHVRQMDEVEFPLDYGRRYRESRLRPVRELWDVYRARRKLVAGEEGGRREAARMEAS